MRADWSPGAAQKVERLYWKYAGAMLRAALSATDDRQLAEDAVQQTFEKVIGFADRIREEDARQTGGLLILMCRQAVTDLYESKIRTIGVRAIHEEEDNNTADPQQTDLLEQLLRKESMERLREAIHTLDGKYGTPLLLKYSVGLSSAQIAKLLGLEENLVNQRLYRARNKIKKILVEKGDDGG